MANMSYVMFENTASDLRDCLNTMMEANDMADLDLSRSELENFEYMRELCQRYLRQADRLTDAESVDFDAE